MRLRFDIVRKMASHGFPVDIASSILPFVSAIFPCGAILIFLHLHRTSSQRSSASLKRDINISDAWYFVGLAALAIAVGSIIESIELSFIKVVPGAYSIESVHIYNTVYSKIFWLIFGCFVSPALQIGVFCRSLIKNIYRKYGMMAAIISTSIFFSAFYCNLHVYITFFLLGFVLMTASVYFENAWVSFMLLSAEGILAYCERYYQLFGNARKLTPVLFIFYVFAFTFGIFSLFVMIRKIKTNYRVDRPNLHEIFSTPSIIIFLLASLSVSIIKFANI